MFLNFIKFQFFFLAEDYSFYLKESVIEKLVRINTKKNVIKERKIKVKYPTVPLSRNI